MLRFYDILNDLYIIKKEENLRGKKQILIIVVKSGNL